MLRFNLVNEEDRHGTSGTGEGPAPPSEDPFTAIDEASRYRVLKIYAQSSIPNAIAFIEEVRRRLPIAIQRVQTDNVLTAST